MIAEENIATCNNYVGGDLCIPDDMLIFDVIDAYLQKQGMQAKWAKAYRKKLIKDWNTCALSFDKKMWAVKRGFLPSRVQLYNLDEFNYMQYLSDMDYWRIHPINNHFAFWINDKITLKNIFAAPIKSITDKSVTYNLMPDYFLYIENDGHFSYLMDSPSHINKDKDYLLNLLMDKKILALKPSNGAGGFGFVKLEYKNDLIVWNDKIISKKKFIENQQLLNGYIVTEYLKQNDEFNCICNKSACTLRVIVVKNINDKYDGGNLDIIASFARFGTNLSQGICNMQAGAVAIPYDSNTGAYGDYFYRYKGFTEGLETRFAEHPDSKISLKGKFLPKYKEVKDVVLTACSHLSSLEYFGVDVVITNDAVKILEINSLPAISTPQVLFGPIFSIPAAKQFFEKKLNRNDK